MNDPSRNLGERGRIAALLAEHDARLRRIVALHLHPLLRRRVELDDVMQEVYLAAHERIEHWKAAEAVPPFVRLRTLALQTVIDLHRRHLGAQKRDAHREVALGDVASGDAISRWLADSMTSPRSKAARAEMQQRVRAIVEGLAPLDREILALRHFEELSNSEAAEVLQIEQKAASIRYVRALKRLREKMAEMSGISELRP